jgi:hypothetical protein
MVTAPRAYAFCELSQSRRTAIPHPPRRSATNLRHAVCPGSITAPQYLWVDISALRDQIEQDVEPQPGKWNKMWRRLRRISTSRSRHGRKGGGLSHQAGRAREVGRRSLKLVARLEAPALTGYHASSVSRTFLVKSAKLKGSTIKDAPLSNLAV